MTFSEEKPYPNHGTTKTHYHKIEKKRAYFTLLVVLDFLYIYIALVLHMIAQREVGNYFFSPPHSTGEYMQVYSC